MVQCVGLVVFICFEMSDLDHEMLDFFSRVGRFVTCVGMRD